MEPINIPLVGPTATGLSDDCNSRDYRSRRSIAASHRDHARSGLIEKFPPRINCVPVSLPAERRLCCWPLKQQQLPPERWYRLRMTSSRSRPGATQWRRSHVSRWSTHFSRALPRPRPPRASEVAARNTAQPSEDLTKLA